MSPSTEPVPTARTSRSQPSTAARPDAARRSPRSRRAILDASLELVGEVGYARLTIEAIAARAGVGKQTIYRWWPSKAAVLLDAFIDHPAADGAGETRLPDTGDVVADLKAVLRATVDEFTDPAFEAPYRALVIAGAEDASLGQQFRERLQEDGLHAYTVRLRAAQDAGEIDPGIDVRLAAETLLGPFTQRWLTRSAPLTHAFVDALVDLVVNGLRARP